MASEAPHAGEPIMSRSAAVSGGQEALEGERGSKASSQTAAEDIEKGSEDIEKAQLAKEELAGEDTTGHVDVAEAKADFASLRRTFSEISRGAGSSIGRHLSQVEDENEHDDFDLKDYMRGALDVHDQNGFAHKEVGVVWKNLSVIGAGGMRIFIREFPDAIKEFILSPMIAVMMRMDKFKKPKPLLHDFNGSAKPGEMVLVLGRPGSGCSTFLKAMANERAGFMEVKGDVKYAGVDALEFRKRFKGEVAYNQEDDMHWPTLTVAQTLTFALRTKTPGKRLPEESKKDFQKAVLGLLLRMLNISHTSKTLVGNAFVRGVSGGERKRVSIAEMMVTNACVCAWDNSTRGLDASTALDYARSLRILTDIFRNTTFVSLYQAGEGIYELFDKVLVIDNGRQVYFGPANQARQYFLDLGFRDLKRQTTADYLTGCTDPNERQFADGRSEEDVPASPERLEEAYNNSKVYASVVQEREAYEKEMDLASNKREEFERAVHESKAKGVTPKSPYTVSVPAQIWALTIRQFQLRMQDKLNTWVMFATSIAIAIIAGSCFLQLPQTSAGAFTRGGAIFIALLFNCFNAFVELPSQMQGRPIMFKQKNFTFYRPGSLSVAGILADTPINFSMILLFCIIIYFMVGLDNTAGAFFTFFLFVYSGFMAMSGFFRWTGTICSNFDVAARFACAVVTAMVVYSGYLVPVYAMKRWLFWFYYMNPLAYGFSALMANEFGRITLECTGDNIVPGNRNGLTIYPDGLGENQVCTLPGATAGNAFVPGRDYIDAAFEYRVGDIWRNFGILVAFFVAFTLLQAFSLEFFKHGSDRPAITVYQKENKERKKLNEALKAKRKQIQERKGEEDNALADMIQTKVPFTWENLTYDVPVAGGQRRLLSDVFGYVQPGTLTALMGASGAGKTTLLDVLAQRKNIGVVQGDMLVDGRKIGKSFQRGTAYAEQLDEHEYTATVREALRFSAYLRQPAHVSKEEKDAYVEEILSLLELEDLADAFIGFPGYGLPVEARKRVTIGVELASKPQLLLFLDEPTSGLDGQSAFNLVRFLRKLAAAGQAILCTIHQPNAFLFEHFDRLLLLKTGGKTVYFGPIGKDSVVLRDYFAARGAVCPDAQNPAEYMLEAIGAGVKRRVGNRDWADLWLDSQEFQTVKREIAEIKKESLSHAEIVDPEADKEFATPWLTQLKVVGRRTFVAYYRNPDYGFTRLMCHVIIALITSLTFLNVGNGVADLQYRVFAIFMGTVLPAIVIMTIEPVFIMGRMTFLRESSSKMYTEIIFALSQQAAEMPYSILCSIIFFVLFYYPIGFNTSSNRAGYGFLMILLLELWAVTIGEALAALSPTIFIAATLNPFILIITTLFCGVAVPRDNMPGFWKAWLYWINPLTYFISGMVSNELQDLNVTCRPSEFYTVNPPAGQTCSAWLQPYVDAVSGYIDNPDATSGCLYCVYRQGQEFFVPLNIDYSNRGRDAGVLIAFIVFNAVVTLIGAKYLTKIYARR